MHGPRVAYQQGMFTKANLVGIMFAITAGLANSSAARGDTFKWQAFLNQKFQAIRTDESTLTISGPIGDGAYEQFKKVFDGKVKTVHLISSGGFVAEAVKMGLDLNKSGVDVVVDGPCMSSCANYLFLAGKRKIIGPDGFIAFHGSPWHARLMGMGRQTTDNFIDHGTISAALQNEINEALKDHPNMTVQDIKKSLISYRTTIKDEREFFDRIHVSDYLIENSLNGRFAETLPECHRHGRFSESEQKREPFLFVTNAQMSAYGVKNLSGHQNWNLASEAAALLPNNKYDDGSNIFCVDVYDVEDLRKVSSQLNPVVYLTPNHPPAQRSSAQ